MITSIVSITVLLAAMVITGLVLRRNLNNPINLSFAGIGASMVVWTTTNILADFAQEPNLELTLSRLTIIAPIFLAPMLLLFAFYFPFQKPKVSSLIKIFIFVPTLLFIPFVLTNYNLSITLTNSGSIDALVPGPIYSYFPIYFVIYVVAALCLLIIKYKKSQGAIKAQLKFMLFGITLSVLFVLALLVASVFLNKIVGATIVSSSLIFFLGFTSYAIIKHRLMDIRLVVARSITYAILLATLALFYAGSVLAIERIFFTDSFDQINLTQGAIRTVLAVIMAFSFQPLRRWITRKTDRIFFKNAYDPQKLLDDLSHLMSSTIVLDALLVKVLEILISDMKISRGIFVLFKEDYSLYTTQTSGYKDEPKIDMKDAVSLARNGTAVYDELDEDSQYKEPLRKFEASISLPLKTEKEIVGVLLLGEKNSGDMFNQQDLRILEIIAPEVSVAIENAKSYEEISRFNLTLKNEVKHATKRLEEKNAQLRELDQAKDEFISMASHQLRTPLTVIKGYLSMLLEGDVGKITKGQEEFVHEAFDGSSRMVGLINDLLNVSRMDTGRFFIEPTEVDIEELVSQEVKELQKQAGDKGLYLKIAKTGKIPHVWVDETKIRQVVMNFIDNALYYTEEGGVTVKLEKIKDMVIYSVVDTGVGIPKAEQPKIFEKFFRAGNARKIRPDGTGLGIYLAKRVVEDHGGEIFFESSEGHGSTFGFKIPYRKHAMPEKDNHTPEPKILDVSSE